MKTMKRKIATLLVGTMLATQPASLPVWGAAVTQPGAPTGSNFQFNFTDLNPSLKNIIQNINITGGTANTLIDTGSGDFHGMEVNHTNHYVYLPFVSPDTGNPDNGTFDNTKTLDGKSWDNIGLEGYAIEHWMTDKENGFGLWRMDGLNYPSNGKTYYAKLKADPSKNYNLRVKYTADTGVYVPGLPANLDTTKNVLDAIPQSPIVPNGFKITNTGADDTVKFFKPNTSPLFTTPFTGFNATDSGFTMDNNKNLSGTMVNKDTEITFNYAVDTGVKKSLQVVDEIYQDAALTVLSGRKGRVGGLYYESALENIGTKNIGPNTNISTKDVTRAASSDRYILKEVNISYIDSDRNIAISNPTANATLLTNDAVSATGNYTRLTANSVSAATGAGEISGQMPNQDVKITYKYYINPAFETTLSVKYMDDRGNDITSLILSEYERANGALPTTTGASNGSKYKEVDGSGNATFLKFKTGYSSTGSYNINIPVPKVANYKYGTDHPKAQLNGGTATWGSSYQTAIANIDSSWSDTNQYFDLTTASTGPIENKEIIVTYAVDPTAIVQLIPINGAGGSIRVANSPTAAEYNVNTDAAINLSRLNQTSTSTTYDVDIKPSDMIYYPVPNAGYRFDHWETSSELGSQQVNLNLGTPQTVTGIPKSKNTITLTAKFTKIPSNFNTYHFNIGGHISPLPLGQDAEIANVDSSGNPINLTFGDLSAYTAVNADTGYTVQWFDGNFNPVDATTPINNLNGQTFTAFAQPTTALVANAPVADAQLHPTNGTPSIQIHPSSIDSRLRYVIVDPITGNVVKIVNGANLVPTAGEITDSSLNPGQSYQVYTALPTAVISVGMPVPSSDVSTPTSTTIPTAINPQPGADPNNRGKAKITISPLSANTDYALIGPNGVVYPFTTPSGNNIVFDNLDPDVNYQIVARPTGTTTDPVTRQATTSPTTVSTANLVIVNPSNDITLIADATPQYTFVRINGTNASTGNPLQGIAEGTQVEIKAAPIDTSGKNFQSWNVVRGLRNYNIVGDRITFTMPNVPVTLQTVFSPISASNTWSKNYVDNLGSNQNVGVIYPVVNEAGDFRIQIIKSSIPTATRNAIAFETDDSFKSVFLMTFNVQKKNPATGNWENYVDPTGADITFDANIETGALLGIRSYGFYELGGSLASPSNAGGNTINPFTGVDFTSPSYTGEFSLTVANGSTYAWGYTLPDDVRKVIVRDARDGSLVSTLNIAPTRVIEDYASLYTANITNDYVDNNGITWHYEGVSDDRNSFVPTDTTTRVLSDATVYLYFSNDRVDRAQAARDLDDLIKQANIELPKVANTGMLQMAIDAAQAVLTKTNRKSSTAELKAAFDALELALKNAGRKSTGGGSSSGGSSGRGSSGGGAASSNAGRGRANTWSGSTPIAVGIGGNWELINPEEAAKNLDNSKWIFKLTTGERVTGWQLLSYTFEGRTKVEWYHFEQDGIMDSGWFLDRDTNKWYYLSMNHDGFFGEMIKGWHHDPDDTRWYFLDRNDGHMHVSWDKIDGNWYFFNPNPPAQTWFFDNTTGRWNYGDNKDIRPLGSMYVNEETPDGFHVNADGAWR
ncbi:N-acetylmuramoyl-L-alanine amidase family protein [Lachnoanaerobaculum gingivalis]